MAKKRASVSENNPLSDMFTRSAPRAKKDQAEAEAKESPAPQPPQKEEEEPETVQTTVILTTDQLEWLDFVSFDSRRGGGRIISKSELFREIVDLLRAGDLNLRGLETSEEIQRRLQESVDSV
jgi:hypothetical protein